MAIQYSFKNMNNSNCQSYCPDKFGCPPDRCPDFTIRRYDTKPEFRVLVEDCDGPLDIQGLVVEVNMWAKGKLKKTISADCEYFALVNNIGFEQIMIGDIIIMDRVRSPEHMLVIGFDECNSLVRVQRGYRNTPISDWKKGNTLRIFRVMNAPAQTEIVFQDIEHVDGTVEENVLSEAFLVYEWSPEDVCLPGCYWMEFKILKMKGLVLYLPGGYWLGEVNQNDDGVYYTGTIFTDSSIKLSYDAIEDKYLISGDALVGEAHLYSGMWFTGSTHNDGSVALNTTDTPSEDDVSYSPTSNNISTGIIVETPTIPGSFSSTITPCIMSDSSVSCAVSFSDPYLTPVDYGCMLGEGVEWARRFPLQGEGFLIRIEDSPTREI